MLELVNKLYLVVPALLAMNIALSAVAQVLVVLGKKEIPLISQACVVLKKVTDYLSANVKHN